MNNDSCSILTKRFNSKKEALTWYKENIVFLNVSTMASYLMKITIDKNGDLIGEPEQIDFLSINNH